METKRLDNPAKARVMSALADAMEAQEALRETFPVGIYGSAKNACAAAARRLRLASQRRARAIWNGEARRIDAHEMAALRAAQLETLEAQKRQLEHRLASLRALKGEWDAAPTTDARERLAGLRRLQPDGRRDGG